MHRRGHTGVVLLACSPIVFVLFQQHNYLLAVIGALGVLAVEPLPDYDLRTPLLSHRGTSHSLVAAIVVGSLLGASGWFLAGTVTDLLQSGVTVLAGGIGLGKIVPDILLRALTDALSLTTVDIERQTRTLAGRTIDRHALAMGGFAIGICGILFHLLGDIITVQGIRPLLPFSRWRISLSSLRAENTLVNKGVFVVGVTAMVLAIGLALPEPVAVDFSGTILGRLGLLEVMGT